MELVRTDELPDDNEDHAAVVKYTTQDGRVTYYLAGAVACDNEVVLLKSDYGKHDDEIDAIALATAFAVDHKLTKVYLVDKTR